MAAPARALGEHDGAMERELKGRESQETTRGSSAAIPFNSRARQYD